MLNDRPKAKIEKTIQVLYPTQLKDLKVGDIVITAELMEIKSIERADHITVTDVGGVHPYVKHIGWGQQGILKVVSGVEKI